MNKAYFAGLLVAAVLGLLAWAVGHKRDKGQYDERQIAARGTAFQVAYFTLLIYLAVYALADGFSWCDQATGVFLGMILSLAVFGVICVMKDAYFAASGITRPQLWLLAAAGALNLIGSIRYIQTGDMIRNGVLTSNGSMNLLCGLLFIIMFLAILIKSALDKRDTGDEES